MRFKAIAFSILISLPVVLVIGGGVAYVVSNVPSWIRKEPARITREYREVAEHLLSSPETASYSGARKKEWRLSSRRINGCPWGCVEGEEHACVWVRANPELWMSKEVDVIHPVPYALIFYWGGSVVALALISLAALAVWSFLRFLRERDDFIAATAHDLTTPLAGLRLQIGRDDDEARTLVDRLLLVVSNLKDFLRLGGRRPPPAKEAIDLVALVAEAYKLFSADYRDVMDDADVDISAEGPVVAIGDSTLVMQILWNLFGNDLKYAAPYGAVSVRVRRDGRFAVVEFVDSGPGMTRREMRKSFDRYYRAKTVLVSGKGGFGIGLCTSREFARAMGGDLTVCANKPSGCVFTLKLPLCRKETET